MPWIQLDVVLHHREIPPQHQNSQVQMNWYLEKNSNDFNRRRHASRPKHLFFPFSEILIGCFNLTASLHMFISLVFLVWFVDRLVAFSTVGNSSPCSRKVEVLHIVAIQKRWLPPLPNVIVSYLFLSKDLMAYGRSI